MTIDAPGGLGPLASATAETTALQPTAEPSGRRKRSFRAPILIIGDGIERGRIIALKTGTSTVGRGADCAVQLFSRGLSRCHLQLELSAAGILTIQDRGSTNGTYVNGNRVERIMLGDGDLIELGPEARLRVSWLDAEEVAIRVEQYERSTRDDLTGVANRRHILASLTEMLESQATRARPVGLILLDLDHFKFVNDAFGHAAGDWVLREVTAMVDAGLGPSAMLGRYGGEEFVILARGNMDAMVAVAERIRASIEALELKWEGLRVRVTVSVAVAVVEHAEAVLAAKLMAIADDALYEAKALGRNQVVSTRVISDT